MTLRSDRSFVVLFTALFLPVGRLCRRGSMPNPAAISTKGQSSSSQAMPQEKAPSLIDPAGPTISLISAEPVFLMAAALNACGYDEGLEESAPVRKRVRDEINQALAKSEDARDKRDKLCLYIAQHRMTGTEQDISQYISLALYLTPPPEIETSTELTEMPPDSTQVVEIVPLLKDFVAAVDLHGIWLAVHHTYDEEDDRLHDPLSKMIVATNLYLKMPASTYEGRRFIVVIEPHALAAHGQCPHLRHRLRGGGFAGERQDSHERRAPHLSALRDRAAALCARQRHGPHAADSEGGARRSARVPLPLRHCAADHRVPDQGHRGADHGYRRSRVQDSRRALTARSCRATSTSGRFTSRRWTPCAWPRCTTT